MKLHGSLNKRYWLFEYEGYEEQTALGDYVGCFDYPATVIKHITSTEIPRSRRRQVLDIQKNRTWHINEGSPTAITWV